MTVLILDIGSSSTRAILFNETADPIPDAHISIPHQFEIEPSGASYIDPLILQTHAEQCIDDILRHSQADTIRAVGMTTFVGNVLGIDTHQRPVTPVYTYADTRSADDANILKAKIDLQAQHQATGCLLHTAYLPARLHWIRRTFPKAYESAEQWIDVGTYLYRQWFGDAPTSYSVAAWTGMLNRAALNWDVKWLETLALSAEKLPMLTDYDQRQRGLTFEYAARWSVLSEVPFFLAVGDGAAANVGSGCVGGAKIALTMGTTAALRRVYRAEFPPPVPTGLWSYRVRRDLHLIGGATTEGGSVFQWMRDTLRLDIHDLDEHLLALEPDQHGLTMLPLFAGERSPGWRADATAAITGMRLSTSPLDILQAGMESIALRLSLIAEQLHAGDEDAKIVAGGGAITASRAWSQMIADAINMPLHITEEKEITARGAAILVLSALGLADLNDFPPKISRVVEPRPQGAAAMRRARERQTALYRTLYD